MNHKDLYFREVTAFDKQTVLDWFNEPHVQEFYYGDGLQNTLQNISLSCQGINFNGRYYFYHWIAFYNDTPFAFLMTSPIKGPHDTNDDYNQWFVKGKKTFTLDVLIGDKDFLGKGLADNMIQQFILGKYAKADFFMIDPEASNAKAIHVYEKVGFKKVGEFTPEFNPKPHVMMQLDIKQLKESCK